MLRSLRVENFRAFRSLSIGHLGAVNLIVGRNNVGKTALLEALELYASPNPIDTLHAMLIEHDEVVAVGSDDQDGGEVDLAAAFHERPSDLVRAPRIEIGPVLTTASESAQPGDLFISVRPFRKRGEGLEAFTELELETLDRDDPDIELFVRARYAQHDRMIPLRRFTDLRRRLGRPLIGQVPRSPLVGLHDFRDADIARSWDAVALRDAERRVMETLQIVAPIERVTMVEHPLGRRRMAMLRLTGRDAPVPLASLGDGTRRLLQIALGVELAAQESVQQQLPGTGEKRPGVLLADELDSGIHYGALGKLWETMFQLAEQRGVQVFATTHSWDCVQGLLEAAAVNAGVDAAIIHLDSKGEDKSAVVFRRDEFDTISRDRIEVR